MAIFPGTSANAPSERTVRQLRLFADQNLAVEVFHLDSIGNVVDTGKSRVLAFLEAEHRLVIGVPARKGQPMQIAVGQTARVRAELKGAILQFETEVLDRLFYRVNETTSTPAIVFRAPRELASGNRRRHFRVEPPFKLRPRVRWRPWTDDRVRRNSLPWQENELRDISCRGIGIMVLAVFGEKMHVGHRLELEISLPASEPPIQAIAVVRRILPQGNPAARHLLGLELEIDSPDPDQGIPRLQTYVLECQREIARARLLEE